MATATISTGVAPRPFGAKDRIGYAFGDMGNDFSFVLASSFLMVFYTNVLGVPAAEVGIIMMVVRLADAFADVTVGRIVDRSPLGPEGRFRPWIIRAAVPVAIASALMYLYMVASWPLAGKLAYIAVSYFLWSVLYSTVNIPYGSMAAVISSDPTDRASLSVFRTFGAFIANILISFLGPVLLYTRIDGKAVVIPERFTLVAIACSVLSIICYVLCYQMSTERVRVETKQSHEAAGMGETLASLVKNRAMVAIVVGALVLLVSTMLVSTMAPYLWLAYFNNGGLQSMAVTLSLLPTLFLLPFATPLARRFGKREVSVVGVGATAIIYVLLYFLNLHSNPWAFILITLLAGFGLGIFNMLIWAFITDVIDYQEVIAHERDDGVVYSVYSWARKVGQALAAGLGGVALAIIGYQSGTGVVQSDSTVHGIYLLSTLVPGVLYAIVALVIWLWYPLSKAKIAENIQILNQRRQAAALTAEGIPAEQAAAAAPQVITIWELYGSGMEAVAAKVATTLGVPLHGQAFSSAQIEQSMAKREKEGAWGRFLRDLSPAALPNSSAGGAAISAAQTVEDTASTVVRDLDEMALEGGLILGRNAAFLLHDRPGSLHVKLGGAVEARVDRAAAEFGIDRARSARRQPLEDGFRRELSQTIFRFDPTSDDYYDLVLDTTRLSEDQVVELIVEAARARADR